MVRDSQFNLHQLSYGIIKYSVFTCIRFPVLLRKIKTTFNKNSSILSPEELLILFIFYTALRYYHTVLRGIIRINRLYL